MSVADMTLPEMVAWGEALGAKLLPPTLVTLRGDLGAGKTTLVQAICRGYGVEQSVTSPTFALVHAYAAPRSRVYHIDLYRLNGPKELQNIGWDDALDERAVVLVEWPERASGVLPVERMELALEHLPGEPARRRLSW